MISCIYQVTAKLQDHRAKCIKAKINQRMCYIYAPFHILIKTSHDIMAFSASLTQRYLKGKPNSFALVGSTFCPSKTQLVGEVEPAHECNERSGYIDRGVNNRKFQETKDIPLQILPLVPPSGQCLVPVTMMADLKLTRVVHTSLPTSLGLVQFR